MTVIDTIYNLLFVEFCEFVMCGSEIPVVVRGVARALVARRFQQYSGLLVTMAAIKR